VQRLHEQSLRFWFVTMRDAAALHGVDREHREVLWALEARDPGRAEAAMRAHLVSFRERIRESL
jgi:DNA-binding GntR family transcriptional regulator